MHDEPTNVRLVKLGKCTRRCCKDPYGKLNVYQKVKSQCSIALFDSSLCILQMCP